MANTEDYTAKLDAIKAIPNDQIQNPALSVDVFLQEAENLYHWCNDDATALAVVGITKKMINDLPVRAGALREAQSLWFKDRYTQQEAQKDWAMQSPEVYELRDELLHAFRFAYRKDEVLLSRVSAIAAGTGHADMIQDLNDLSVLGKANPDALVSIGFNATQLDTAVKKADAMADLLATANCDKAEQNESKTTRDKAYTYLKEMVDEIRESGKYVFWKNPERYQGYISQYWKNKNREKVVEPEETT